MLTTASLLTLALSLASVASAQNIGTLTAETHPKLSWSKCTKSGGCSDQSASVVLDANWRWLHSTSGSNNCYTGNTWDATLCPDPATCAQNCAVDGADYSGTYGITTSGNAITQKFVTIGPYSTNVGSRVYLMDTSDSKYQIFYLKNQEFTFDVDVSKLPCGFNGALYFVEMDADGGSSKYATNKAGAKYGTGYCDAQCPHDIKFINGEANVLDWTPSSTDSNAGSGRYGTCCPEMDIWEANSISNAYTPHPCTVQGQTRCDGTDCGDGSDRYSGVCDKDGCDINPYRMGNLSFYGPGTSNTIDTNSKLTVVTQFITSDGTASGTLTEIRRKWVQNGVVISNANVNIPGIPAVNSITDTYCKAQKSVFGDTDDFETKGGLAALGDSMARGQVLVMSIWGDYAAQMLWLDSDYPTDADPTTPGVARGTCSTTSGNPADLIKNSPNAQVVFSNIRFGDLDSTYGSTGTTTTTSRPTTTTTSQPTTTSGGGSIPKYAQCGGQGWTGSGTCVSGTTCQVLNAFYSQCL
ncbi:glycoside hydrolase [Sphaerosporella brunnea]|uniref:Glucanase n=1 Tax=Sphaerosporella brunnea TaxID=1250544 RepID=A0A5J5EYF5_9PEZI|nr:glycoside hydrolase [Sphaerosporella brunnea]